MLFLGDIMLEIVEIQTKDDLSLSDTLFILRDYLARHWESKQSDNSSSEIWLDEAYLLLDKREGLSCVVPNKLTLPSLCQYRELRDYFHPDKFIEREEIYFDHPPVSNTLRYWNEKFMEEGNRRMLLPISSLYPLDVCSNSYILESDLSYGLQLGKKCLSKLNNDSYQFVRKNS